MSTIDELLAGESKIAGEYLRTARILATWLALHDPVKRDADTIFAVALTQARDPQPSTPKQETASVQEPHQ